MAIDETSAAWWWLLGLGAVHGVNPAMGWLFAVALGLQERSARAVWRALLPLAVGHALAVGAAILLAAVVGLVLPLAYLKWVVAVALLLFAVRQLVRHSHPRWGGMRIGRRDLAIWSLLMASAHGAGLMVLPVLLHDTPSGAHALHAAAVGSGPASDEAGAGQDDDIHGAHHGHIAERARAGEPSRSIGRMSGLVAALVHTLGYLLTTGFVALMVYGWAGLRLLRSAWINLDLLWAVALMVTALATPFL